jgi:hypothetical protein
MKTHTIEGTECAWWGVGVGVLALLDGMDGIPAKKSHVHDKHCSLSSDLSYILFISLGALNFVVRSAPTVDMIPLRYFLPLYIIAILYELMDGILIRQDPIVNCITQQQPVAAFYSNSGEE